MRNLHGEARLADAARSDERDQATVDELLVQRVDLGGPPDDPCEQRARVRRRPRDRVSRSGARYRHFFAQDRTFEFSQLRRGLKTELLAEYFARRLVRA